MNDKFPVRVTELLAVGGWISLAYTLSTAIGLSKSAAAVLAILLFVIIVILMSIQRLWTVREFRFQLSNFEMGQVAYNTFENAEESIYVTHFTSALPDEVYVAKMLQLMEKKGVNITRLLPPRNLSQEWLGRFRAHKRYTECVAPTNELPFDFLIVDREHIVFALPTHQNDTEFRRALVMQNREMATIFHGIFDKLGNEKESNHIEGA